MLMSAWQFFRLLIMALNDGAINATDLDSAMVGR